MTSSKDSYRKIIVRNLVKVEIIKQEIDSRITIVITMESIPALHKYINIVK